MTTRRKFLQKITLSTAFILFFRCSEKPSAKTEKENQSNDKVLRVAIMGLGSYGNRVAEAMLDCKRAKLTGVISGTPSKIKDWQGKYNIPNKNCYNYENFDQVKNNPDIDAVYI